MPEEDTQIAGFFQSLVDDEFDKLLIELVGKGLEPKEIVDILLSKAEGGR
jgi:hypothetical protein